MKEARLQVIQNIAQCEREGRFDAEVEPTFPYQKLDVQKLDLTHRKLLTKIKSWWAYLLGEKFFKSLVRKGEIIFKEPQGLENLQGLRGGAIVTCNHIHPSDSYGVLLALMRHYRHGRGSGKRLLWKVVAESNYSFPGMIGFLMRYADTIPIAIDPERPNHRLVAHAMQTAQTMLRKGKKLLIYPEASMWLHYRQPRPLKKGAFLMAAKFFVPIIPCFYTLADSDRLDSDGFPVQEYTLHILPPLYPDHNATDTENADRMLAENTRLWQEIAEKCYHK